MRRTALSLALALSHTQVNASSPPGPTAMTTAQALQMIQNPISSPELDPSDTRPGRTVLSRAAGIPVIYMVVPSGSLRGVGLSSWQGTRCVISTPP